MSIALSQSNPKYPKDMQRHLCWSTHAAIASQIQLPRVSVVFPHVDTQPFSSASQWASSALFPRGTVLLDNHLRNALPTQRFAPLERLSLDTG